MEDLLRDYYRRFRTLPETVRLLVIVTCLGVWCLYMLGLISLIAAPRLRQAPIAYAEAVVVTATFTPTEIPSHAPSALGTPTEAPPLSPTATRTSTETAGPLRTATATLEATPTQEIPPTFTPTPPPSPTRRPSATPTSKPSAA